MDSPGLFDTAQSHEVIAKHIEQAISAIHPHAVLFTFAIGSRFTVEQFNTFDRLKHYFGQNFVARMVFVFTHGDRLEESGKSMEEYLTLPHQNQLQKVLGAVGHRYAVFNNRAVDHNQVQRLLHVIESMDGSCYEADGQYKQTLQDRLRQAEQAETQRKPHFKKMQGKLNQQLKQEKIEALVHKIEVLKSEMNSLETEAMVREVKIYENQLDMTSKRLVFALQTGGAVFTLGLSLIGVRERWKEIKRIKEERARLCSERENLMKKEKSLQAEVEKLEEELYALMVAERIEDTITLSRLLVESNAIDTRSILFENMMKKAGSFYVKWLDMCRKSDEFQNMVKEVMETLTPKVADIELD